LFSDLDGEVTVMRYHSLIIDPSTLHEDLKIVATSSDDQEIMAIQHKYYPVFGLQFHPESIGTETGTKMVETFFKTIPIVKS
jgi:anthranilate synthase component II